MSQNEHSQTAMSQTGLQPLLLDCVSFLADIISTYTNLYAYGLAFAGLALQKGEEDGVAIDEEYNRSSHAKKPSKVPFKK